MRLGMIYLGKSGGICQYTYELAKAMCARTELIVFVARENALLDEFQALPCKVHVLDFNRGPKSLVKSLLIGGEAKRIAQEVLGERLDVVLDSGSAGWCNAVMIWLSGKTTTAAVIHDVCRHPGWKDFKEMLPMIARPVKSDAIVLLSHFAYKKAAEHNIKKAKIESRHGIILGGSDIDLDQVVESRNRLLFFGRIDPYKGIEYLVEAFAILKGKWPGLSLTIAGSGQIEADLMADIKANGIELVNRYVSENEAQALFSSHGLVVMPYTSATQSGVAAAALANGLPAIATDVGALPEQVIDGLNGMIVPPADSKALAEAIIDMVGDEKKFRQMAEEALKLGRTVYSWETIAERLLHDLNGLAQSTKERADAR